MIRIIGAIFDATRTERWERRFFEATKTFLEGIAAMDSFDLVVGILWKRVGTELPPEKFRRGDGSAFESGTVFEIESALVSHRELDRPSVFVWWARTFRDSQGHYTSGTNQYNTLEDFDLQFETFLVDWLQNQGYISRGPTWNITAQGSPYPGLLAYDRDRTPVFFGRQYAVAAACEELKSAA